MVNAIVKEPPEFCQYADDPCDQDFVAVKPSKAIFLYPADPSQIAATIESAVKLLRTGHAPADWLSWRDLGTVGQIIFCAVCRGIRFSETVFADVTTLNFNLLFEIGYTLGLSLPVAPIRDTSFIRDAGEFTELGLLDTLGYIDFRNSQQLADAIRARLPIQPIPTPPADLNLQAPLYVLKGPHETEGEIKLLSEIKKSVVHFRTYDVVETPRVSLHEIRKQINASLGVVAHLLSADRRGARVHNARAALIAGIAMAQGKAVLMLQEGVVPHPIDYRDVVACYERPDQIPRLVNPLLMRVIERLQSTRLRSVRPPEGLLQKLDLGDLAAENEIRLLRDCFVATGQYHEARRGHARLVTGRKGSGKTAIFYAVRDSFGKGHAELVLDLKPEGHQFTRLREVVLSRLSAGVQEHTLTAFWNAILLAELAHKIVTMDSAWAFRDPSRRDRYERVDKLYSASWLAEEGDFSERLLKQVDRLAETVGGGSDPASFGKMTENLFRTSIRDLSDAVGGYLQDKRAVWLLVDNLDKGWPTGGASSEDILILRALLEASRKLQRELDRQGVPFQCLVFIRNDIYDHLLMETPDKGKDTAITVDWADTELFKAVFRLRVLSSGLLTGSFDELWSAIFDHAVGTQSSFEYVTERTLLRPRDFLMFIHRSIEVAINRGHTRVLTQDLVKAEEFFSDDMLKAMAFELEGGALGKSDSVYAFIGCSCCLAKEDVEKRLFEAGVPTDQVDKAVKLLAWFGFLGVEALAGERALFAYQMRYDLPKLLAPIVRGQGRFVIHPAFRTALGCTGL
jgi:hypothetical protein